MSSTETDKDLEIQLEAIKAINDALKPLTLENRERVLQYVLGHLGISLANSARVQATSSPASQLPAAGTIIQAPLQRRPDIRSFAEEKKPKTAGEMAAVVGFFLSELAPQDEKLDEVSNPEIIKLYKQSQFMKLPKDPKQLLKSAAKSGYFDSVSHGKYKLNAVGYNLVAHNLPHASSDGEGSRRAPRKKSKKPRGRK
jgi:hypothetical protein